MNVASRMESNGVKGRIQLSQATAGTLIAAGKSHWLIPREDLIIAKGKGQLQTYFLTDRTSRSSRHGSSVVDSESSRGDQEETMLMIEKSGGDNVEHQKRHMKALRLIDWNVEVLSKLLQQIIVRREMGSNMGQRVAKAERRASGMVKNAAMGQIQEVISLPAFDEKFHSLEEKDKTAVELPEHVSGQLNNFVKHIASMYRNNACTLKTPFQWLSVSVNHVLLPHFFLLSYFLSFIVVHSP